MSQISAMAEAAIRSRIGAVSDLRIDGLRTRIHNNRAVNAGWRPVEIDITLTGWACSLHSHNMRWRETVELRENATGEEQARAMNAIFAQRIANQKARLVEGIAMGLAVPLNRVIRQTGLVA